MSTVDPNPRLRALDPDLPFLLSEVAIDIDNMLLGTANDKTAMRRLAEKLSQAIQPDPDGGPLCSRMDMATLTVLGEAVFETVEKQSIRNINELLERAKGIAAVLAKSEPDNDRQGLEQARSFCVALSRAAAAYSESIHDLNPPHPSER